MTEAAPSRRETALRRAATAAAALALCEQWGLVAARPRGDFALHAGFARRLAAGGELYAGGNETPYPPAFALAFLPFAPLPDHLGQILAYPLGVAALALLVASASRAMPARTADRSAFWAGAAALLLASRFILRDLFDGGANLALAALVWTGVLLWRRGRDGAGGALLGVASALKLTPLVFVLLFAWKRQWRLVAAALAAALLVTFAPALWLGPSGLARALSTWAGNVGAGLASGDPSTGVLGPEKVTNVALRPALARLLTGTPAGAGDATGAAASFRGLGLTPAVAGPVTAAAVAAVFLGTLAACRRPIASRHDPRVPREAAAFGVLALLVSPITWRAHAVAALPALLLLTRDLPAVSRPRALFLAAWVVVVLLLNEAFAGRDLTRLLSAVGAYTALLGALLVLTLRGRAA